MKAVNALSIATALWSVALADELSMTVARPALAGYCVQSLRNEISLAQQAVSSCGTPLTSQQCYEITKPVRTTLVNNQRTFDLWRVYALGLGSDSAAEILRGTAEARADIAYLNDFATGHSVQLPPSASTNDFAKAAKDAAAADPRIRAIQDRVSACHAGPPL